MPVRLLSLVLLLLTACAAPHTAERIPTLQYAEQLEMEESDSGTLYKIHTPWDAVPATYFFSSTSTPKQRTVCSSVVHAALAEMLGAERYVWGVCDAAYVASPSIQARLQGGEWRDAGSSMAMNAEYFLANGVDAVLYSPYEGAQPLRVPAERIQQVPAADYLETSPLGRAEWMRFYGRLWGRGAEADSLFAQVVNRYVQRQSGEVVPARKPLLLCDLPMSGTWYVPGGRSTMAALYQDAGARYPWADDDHVGGLPLSEESILQRAAEADVWVIKSDAPPRTYADLQAQCAVASRIRAFQQRRVFVCCTLEVPFYEETPFRPDLLLEEIQRILRGETESLRYFRALK